MRVEEHFERFTERDWQELAAGGPIRFAIVGLGGFARERALPAIEGTTFCETTTVVSGSSAKARDTAAEFGVEHVLEYDSFERGDAKGEYDAVYVATPPAFHPKYAVIAAELGKHVLCEKPLAVDADGAERIIDACEDADVTLMTAYRLQTEPAMRRTRELLRDGCIGMPVQIHAGFSSKLLDTAGPDTWRLDADLAGGGALIDLGIYPLNTLRFLLDRDPVAVRAETTSVHEAFDDVDEHVAFQLSLPDGITASCTASFNAHRTSGLQVIGTEGQVEITSVFGGDVPQDLLVECGDVSTEYTGPPVDEVVEEFDYFAHCVLADETPEPDGYDGLADLEAIGATYEAAETGGTVPIDYRRGRPRR